RYAFYYLPFLFPLVSVGFYSVMLWIRSALPRARSAARLNFNGGLGSWERLAWPAVGVILMLGWIVVQASYVVPAMWTMHSEVAPTVRAVEFVREHYEARDTLIVSKSRLISRHLDYYAAGAGFSGVWEPSLGLDMLRGVRHILRVEGEGNTAPGRQVGAWRVDVRHGRELLGAGHDGFLRVAVYEPSGPVVFLRGWHDPEPEEERSTRWSKAEGSQIWIVRLSPGRMKISLRGEVPRLPGRPTPPPLAIHINGRPTYEVYHGYRVNSLIEVPPGETGEVTVVEVRPGCTFVPAELFESDDSRRLGCFRMTDVSLEL
ncbi:MAG: hypothetical protein ACE5JD_06450, partial [Candidatus Methylomirabilia bacterium]